MSGIKVKLRVKKPVERISLTKPSEVKRVLKEGINIFTRSLRKDIPDDVASGSGMYKTSFRKIRTRQRLAKVSNLTARFWFGENDVQTRFKKGRWRQNKSGAGKGRFFVKGAFLVKFKSGHKGVYKRSGVKTRTGNDALVEQRFSLDRPDFRVGIAMDNAERNVLDHFRKRIKGLNK